MSDRPAFPRRATLRDVAALAGVSTKTASRVINGEKGVVAAKVEAVQQAVSVLDYRPDFAASSLRRSDGRTAVIAALLQNVANSFSSEVHRALEIESSARGVLIVAGSVEEDPARELRLVREFVARRVDALVMMAASTDQHYLAQVVPPQVPVVFVDRPPTSYAADAVVTDNAEASAGAVAHLADHGHRRIAILTDDLAIPTARERLAGFRTAMAERGLLCPPEFIVAGVASDDVAGEISNLLGAAEPPTAFFTARNDLTVRAYRHLHRVGLSHEVALLGFDDLPWADLVEPGISVMAQNPGRMGLRVADIVFGRLAGDDSPPKVEVVPSVLVARGSGEIGPRT